MSRVLLAWELGANFGHVGAMRGLALALRDAGHECFFAVRELAAAETLALHTLGPVVQTPRAPPSTRAVAVQTSYATLLYNTGFDDSIALAARLRAWQTLLQTLRIDAVAVNYAPTAALAARALQLPRAAFGASFGIPPPQQPFPWFQPSGKANVDVLLRNEARVLGVVNAALERLGGSPLPALQAIYEGCAPNILSFAELDTYGPGRESACLGHPDYSHGSAPQWPDHRGPRVYAYLRPGPWLPPLLEALRDGPFCALLRIADAPASSLARYARPGLHFASGAVHASAAMRDADLVVHAGQDGTSSETLLAGKPALALPVDVEKVLITRRLIQLGAGLAPVSRDSKLIREALDRLIDDAAPRAAAERFAQRYRALDRAQIMPRAAQSLIRQL